MRVFSYEAFTMLGSLSFQRSRLSIACSLLLAFALLVSDPPSAAGENKWGGPSLREFSGVNQVGTDNDLFEKSISWAREDMDWGTLQPKRNEWNQSALDEKGKKTLAWRERGVSYLPVLCYTAPWAGDAGKREWINGEHKWSVTPNVDGKLTVSSYDFKDGAWTLKSSSQEDTGYRSRCPPANVADCTGYVTRVTKYLHAKPYGVQYFQIWNEASNFSGFWNGSMDDYMRKVHLPAAAAIHAAGGKVVYGGWPCCESIKGLIDILDKYKAWDSIDVIDIHYFNPADMAALRKAADARGYSRLAIWQTEIGFTTGKTYIADNYPRVLYWALNHKWDRPDKYKLFYFANWAPDDPKAYGYQCSFHSGSALNFHGVTLQNLATMFQGARLEVYHGVTTTPSLSPSLNIGDSSIESFRAGNHIVLAVHLTAKDCAIPSLLLTLPVKKDRVAWARRVDLTGKTADLADSRAGKDSTSFAVATADVEGSDAKQWNESGKGPRTFFVEVGLR